MNELKSQIDERAEPGRRERKRERMHKTLLDCAAKLFAKRGIYDTRIEDITEMADLGKGAFYNYFESKEQLVAALFVEGVNTLGTFYVRTPQPDLPMEARIRQIVRCHDAFFAEHPVFAILFHQVRGMIQLNTAGVTELRAAIQSYLRVIADFLFPPGCPERPNPKMLQEVSTAVAGTIAGHRSYSIAAGGKIDSTMAENMIVGGVMKLISPPG